MHTYYPRIHNLLGVPSSMYFLLNSNLVNTPLLASFTRPLDFWNAGVISSKFQTFPALFFSLSLALLPAYCANTYSALIEKSGPDDQTVSILAPKGPRHVTGMTKSLGGSSTAGTTSLAQSGERLRQTRSTGGTVSPAHQAPPRPERPTSEGRRPACFAPAGSGAGVSLSKASAEVRARG